MGKKGEKQGKGAALAPEVQRPSQPGPRKCKHIKANGKPCRAQPMKDGDFCRIHDPRPAVKAAVKASNIDGGKQRTAVPEWQRIEIKTKEDLRRFVDKVVDHVATGKMSSKVSYALAPHLALMAKLFEDCPPSQVEDATPAVLEVLQDHPDVQAKLLALLRPGELEP
jgi:hypothetical protein